MIETHAGAVQRFNYIQSDVDRQFLAVLSEFSKNLSLYGYRVAVSSPKSLQKLSETPDQKKLQIINYYSQWNSWIQPQAGEIIEEDIPVEKEIGWAKKALALHGFSVSDEFWRTVQKEHLLEIYDSEMTQIYRSFSFFRVTSYSLADLSLFEWWVLWDRSTSVVEAQMLDVTRVMQESLPVLKATIPRHLVREIFDAGETTDFQEGAAIVEYFNLGVVTKFGMAKGFIVSETAEIVARGEDVMKLGFV